MNHTELINHLHDRASPEHPSGGKPARIWLADVVTVNPDGTVDCQPLYSRATKVRVPVPSSYLPAVKDRVVVCDLNGDPRVPLVLGLHDRTRPVITGSKSDGHGTIDALANLLAALADLGLVVDHTT